VGVGYRVSIGDGYRVGVGVGVSLYGVGVGGFGVGVGMGIKQHTYPLVVHLLGLIVPFASQSESSTHLFGDAQGTGVGVGLLATGI
jgi:hypothetical protein